jgi:homoserine O-acetyltransferase
MYPEFVDRLMPLQCLPVEIAGMNRMLRRIIIDGIRNDPDWQKGEYEKQPTHGLTIAAYGALALFSSPTALYNAAPSRDQANALFERVTNPISLGDANDALYEWIKRFDTLRSVKIRG